MSTTTTKRCRLKQAPALVVSLVALFAALSGAAVALPGTETVNSGDIKNESVKSVDLKDGKAVASSDVIDESLTGTDVQDETLTGTDVQDETLTGTDVQNETLGSQDVANGSLQSADIANDSVGQADLAPNSVRAQELGDGIHTHQATILVAGGTAQNANYNFNFATASCGAGEELISGSGHWQGDATGEELMLSEVILNHNAETVTVKGGNDFGVDRTLVASAHCL